MKNFIKICLSILLLFLIASCNKGDTNTNTNTNINTNTNTNTNIEAKLYEQSPIGGGGDKNLVNGENFRK